MKNGPDLWEAVLAHVRETHPEAIVAGGCVRDFILGKPAKDIDIMVPERGRSTPEGESFRRLRSFDPAYTGEGSDHTVKFVETFTATVGTAEWEVQVIHVHLPEFTHAAVLQRIDLGICRASYRGMEPMGDGMTPLFDNGFGFHEDAANRTMTVYRADTLAQFDGSHRRFLRLLDKYPDHEFRDGRGAQ